MEARIWKENQWGYFSNRKLNDIHENSQNFLITSVQKDISETEAKRTQLIEDVKTFASSTELSNRKRISIMLPAGFDAALTSKPIVEKSSVQSAFLLSFLSGFRRNDARNCESFKSHGLRAISFNK